MAEHDLDYYAILGVATDADEATIRLAFRRLALRFHPDVAGPEYAERMGQINDAYRVLNNPEQRSLYDYQHNIVAPAPRPPLEPEAPQRQTPPTPRPPLRRTVTRGGSLTVSPGPLKRVAILEHAEATPIAALHLAATAPFLAVGLLDGRVMRWNILTREITHSFAFQTGASAGVLQDVRLSPSGAYLAAWGFELGTRVWSIGAERPIWKAGINGPNGAMDIALTDAPPLTRMALPDAPLAIADDDPFRWAHEGREGTAIFARPLVGAVDPAWAVPLRCHEAPSVRERQTPTATGWRVQRRMLSSDGAKLLTVSTSSAQGHATLRVASLWELPTRGHGGALQPRTIARIAEPLDAFDFPIAASADLTWLAASNPRLGIRLHNLATRRTIALSTGGVSPDAEIAVSPDGMVIGLATNNGLTLWNPRDGKPLQTWTFAAEVTSISCGFSGDRTCWVIGLANGAVEIWA